MARELSGELIHHRGWVKDAQAASLPAFKYKHICNGECIGFVYIGLQ